MASLPSHQQEQQDKKPTTVGIQQLLTPEEPLAHSFSESQPPPPTLPPTQQPASPPASPEFSAFKTQQAFEQTDDVLYPDRSNERRTPDRPLFDDGKDSWAVSPSSTQNSPSVPTHPSPHDSPHHSPRQTLHNPKRLPSSPLAPGTYSIIERYNSNPQAYYRWIMAQNEERSRLQRESRRLPPPNTSGSTNPRDSYTDKVVSLLGRPARVEKPKSAAQTTPKTRVAKPAGSRPVSRGEGLPSLRGDSTIQRSRRRASTPDASAGAYSQAIQPKARTRAPPSKKLDEYEAEDWQLIADYCPPLSSLDNGKKLVVQWTNSNALDLSKDPDREHLHSQEIEIAQALRLKCNQYLANKRRIFLARVMALKDGKDFNKTSAQTSTKIDVNKASRLWTAFDNVGWFEENWFAEYL